MTIALVVKSNLNDLGYKTGFTDPFPAEWLAHRMELYIKYTVRSLKNQAEPHVRWLDCRPGSEKELEPHMTRLASHGVAVTFDRGHAFLDHIVEYSSGIILTRIDSDDMYLPGSLTQIRKIHDAGHRYSQFNLGYWLNLRTYKTGTYRAKSSPFYSITYSAEEVKTRKWAPMKLGSHRGHGVFKELYRPVIFDIPGFCVLKHKNNTERKNA